MNRWPSRIALLVLAAIVVALVFETRDMAVQVGEAERAAKAAEQRAQAAEEKLRLPPVAGGEGGGAESDSGPGTRSPGSSSAGSSPAGSSPSGASDPIDLDAFTKLQVDLHTTRQKLEAVTNLLEQRNAEIERRRKEAADQARKSLQPMPAGVRLCLDALHECLRRDGYIHQRFLRASSLDKDGLHDVEMIESSEDGLAATFVVAERMTASLDRATGRLELRFYEGHRSSEGERAALPEDGFVLTFDEVEGPLFEARLPYLVKADGAYPKPVTEAGRPATDVDAGTRRQWLARFDALLAKARLTESWRVTRFRGMDGADFLTVELIGTDDKNHIKASAHCDRLAVEIDEKAGVVSLLLRSGVLRRGTLESTISGQGYRMLLPGLTPKETIDAMLGMVVRK